MPSPSLFVLAAGLAALPLSSAQATGDPLQPYRWNSRVLVALAPSPNDPALQDQRRIFHGFGAEGRDRDLVLVQAIDGTPEGDALRRRFGGGAGFRAILVGKDGGEKLKSGAPLHREDLFPLIDAMPMRRQEMSSGR
jgi:hypothetical protein